MRDLLIQALQGHDTMAQELENTKRQLAEYKRENETLLKEVAAAATQIQELEASQRHIQTVMSARVVTAAVDIVEEFSKRALNEVKEKASAKLADLFEPGPKPRPVNTPNTAADNVEERIEEMMSIEHYAPKKSMKQKAEEMASGTAIPAWLTKQVPYKEPDSLVRRIIFAFIGG